MDSLLLTNVKDTNKFNFFSQLGKGLPSVALELILPANKMFLAFANRLLCCRSIMMSQNP